MRQLLSERKGLCKNKGRRLSELAGKSGVSCGRSVIPSGGFEVYGVGRQPLRVLDHKKHAQSCVSARRGKILV